MQKLLYPMLLLLGSACLRAQAIIVHLDSAAQTPLKGRLYVFSVTDTSKRVQAPDPFNPSPVFCADVQNWRGGETRRIDAASAAYPVKMSDLKPGYYKFAAILDTDTLERTNAFAPGNWYSKEAIAQVKPGENAEIHLYLQRQFKERTLKESDQIKEIRLKSSLVSAFLRRDAYIKAAIILPPGYAQNADAVYPVVYIIPGWGGTHYDAPFAAKRYGVGMGKEKIYVYLNPETNTPFGLHAFVDSRVNGPWGKALVEELGPHLIERYRAAPNRNEHFVMGQSSGGYGALWLQMNYPKSFGGCWAVSPDPVDFSDFCSVDIYNKKSNMYYNESGKERPFFLMNGQYLGSIKNFSVFENFLGDGGQMQAFEAEFGLPDEKGRPRPLFDRVSGRIDPAVAKAWRPYDMGNFLVRNYARIAKDIDGKVHVYAGSADNFYLDRSVKRFQEKAARIKANVAAELIPDADHWSIWSEAFVKRVQSEIDARIH